MGVWRCRRWSAKGARATAAARAGATPEARGAKQAEDCIAAGCRWLYRL